MQTTYIAVPSDFLDKLFERVKAIENKITEFNRNCHKEFLTEKEFRKLLGISAKTSQNYRNRGQISFIRKGHLYFYKYSDVHEFMEKDYFKKFN